jgi:hypothetical protein
MTTWRNAQYGRTLINTVGGTFNGSGGFTTSGVSLVFFPGTVPTEVGYLSASSNTIVSISLPATSFTLSGVVTANSHATISKTGTWSGTVTSTNTATWGYFNLSGATNYVLGFSAGTNSGEMRFNDTHFLVDGTVVIDTCDIGMAPSV